MPAARLMIRWMLQVPRAPYYRWLDPKESPTAARHRELTGRVKAMFDSSDRTFGHCMVHMKFAVAGVEVSVGDRLLLAAPHKQ